MSAAGKKRKQPWEQWQEVTKPLYLRCMKGWPRAEMRGYWESGMSPLQAYDAAVQRRIKQAPVSGSVSHQE